MSNPRIVRAAIALVALALAIVGYFLIVPNTFINSDLLGRLVLANTGLKGVAAAPTYSAPLPTVSSPLSALTAAAAENPGTAGSYARNWFGPLSTGNSVDLSAELLPTRQVALTTQSEAGVQDIGAAALKTALHTVTARFTVPGGTAVTYTTPRPVPKSGPQGPPVPGAAADFSFGRVVIRMTMTGPVSTRPSLVGVVDRQLTLLKRVEPNFPTLSVTSYSTIKSIVYWVIAILLIVALALVPDWVRRVRAQRRARELARQRRQVTVRGSKALKRHRVRV